MVMENTVKEYTINEKGQFSCQYYLVFCTKYNRRVFVDSYYDTLNGIITKLQGEFIIKDAVIGADVIQCIIECQPDISIQKCVNSFKSSIAKELYLQCPELKKRMPQMWERKNFISTMGDVMYNSVYSYIENQRKE